MRLKDKEHYLPLDQEIEHVRGILSNNAYLSSIFYKLYGDRLNLIGWLNEYALDDTFDKPKEEAILKEMSEIEKRDKMIEDLQKQLEEKTSQVEQVTKQVEEVTKQKEELTVTLSERDGDVADKKNILEEKETKITEMTKEIEEKSEKIKELEDKSAKQKETFRSFKKDVTEQLRLIETMMKKDMTKINKIDSTGSTDELDANDDENEETGSSSGKDNENENDVSGSQDELNGDNGMAETYKKVESYVKRLLEELKKAKEQNYIYKSQIAQNDKINAILNEKIYQYSEKACMESNSVSKTKASSKTDLSKKKKFVPS
jgi:chromosome segregation ATPase